VTQVTTTRRSVVFNFWHPANSPELAEAVTGWVDGLDFGALPDSLESIAVEAESRLPEERTYTASLTAWILQQWGYPTEVVVAGYSASLAEVGSDSVVEEDEVAIALACWVAELRHGHFSLQNWERLRGRIASRPSGERIQEALALCVPVGTAEF